MLTAAQADASFHFARIERVLTGLEGTTDVQFVEIQMDAVGQNLVAGSKLIAFKADGTFAHVILTVPSKVESGAGTSWLMASAAFETEPGMAPDFVFDATGGKGLLPKDGMVCWGKPTDQTKPDDNNMIDCVSYGKYTGPANGHTAAPSAFAPFGHGLMRDSSTGSSAADFVCQDPTTSITNAPDKRGISATSPCTGCGNYAVEEFEACDDSDALFAAGDSCSSGCALFPCGIPTKVDGTAPTTSDALFVLRGAINGPNCDPLVCDVNNSDSVTASDALLILRRAVGQPIEFDCPSL